MKYEITTATKKIRALKKRIRAVQGGTSASKTIGIIQNLIDFAQSDENPTLTSIVAETFPHLRKGARLDFLSILKAQNYFKKERWNKTDSQYTCESGSIIEFFSADDSNKVRGPRRDRLFVNEANLLPFETFDQLELRTNEFMYLDWNPTREFWFDTEVLGKRDDVDHIILTYKDNEAIPPAILKSLLLRQNRPGWWKVYGEGQLGEIEGRIYTGWQVVDRVPYEARLERYGLDFGYSNDPTVIVAIYYYNGGYIVEEVAYLLGMSNRQIADTLLALPKALVRADSAEPKSIDELKNYGLNVIGAKKGAGSVNQGIQFVQSLPISITRNSTRLRKSYDNYLWKTDRDGKTLNEPDHYYSDGMDAVRYGMEDIKPTKPFIQRPFYDRTIDIWRGR